MKFLQILDELENKYKNLKKCVIIGSPIKHSLSPAMHNAGYKSLNITNNFIFDKIDVEEDELEEFFVDLKNFNKKNKSFIGITCTMPHKINVIKYLDEIKAESKIIKSVNSVLFDGERYIGYNTDWYGIEQPFLEKNINLINKKVAIIGAGGASRSAIYTFKKNHSIVSVFNRTKNKADLLAKEFNISAFDMNDIDELATNDIIINATNVGMGELSELSPINTDILNKNHIIFECIYNPKETILVKTAKNVGATVFYGWEMLLYQGVKQFEIYTGLKPNINSLMSVL